VSDVKKEEKKDDAPKAAGGGKKKVLAILGLLLVVGVSSVAGAALSPIIGPRVSGAPAPPKAPKPHAAPKDEGEPAEEEEEEGEGDKGKKESHGLVTLEAAVVDLRDATGETHHLKIAIAIEVKAEVPEEEAKVFVMRAKDAEITYLRTLSYEDVTDHSKFEQIRKELSTRVLKAFGKKHGKKMLITEYVVQ
jgi:flagellar basal body-associated protein FliL